MLTGSVRVSETDEAQYGKLRTSVAKTQLSWKLGKNYVWRLVLYCSESGMIGILEKRELGAPGKRKMKLMKI